MTRTATIDYMSEHSFKLFGVFALVAGGESTLELILVGIASSARLAVSQFLYSYTISVDEVDFDEVSANA